MFSNLFINVSMILLEEDDFLVGSWDLEFSMVLFFNYFNLNFSDIKSFNKNKLLFLTFDFYKLSFDSISLLISFYKDFL